MRTIRFLIGCDMTYLAGEVYTFDPGVADCYVNVRRVAEYIDVPVPSELSPASPLAFLASAPKPAPVATEDEEPFELPQIGDPHPLEKFTANQVVDVPLIQPPKPNRRTGRPREIARTGAGPKKPNT